MARFRLGVDIGGTFTDLTLADESGEHVFEHKVPSTPKSPSAAVARGVKELMARVGAPASAVDTFVHGTTIALNAILERRGGPVALFVSRGNRDILQIGRLKKPDIFNLRAAPVPPLVPRRDVIEVDARIAQDGTVVIELSDAALTAALDAVGPGIASTAICLLNAHANAGHEVRLQAAVEQRFPDLPCSRSSDLWPEIREYERATVTALNAYVRPIMTRAPGPPGLIPAPDRAMSASSPPSRPMK